MTVIQFLAEWALRSSILILAGAALLWVLRVKDSSIRLAAWMAMLAGSLLIPVMTAMLPDIPLHVMPALTPTPSTATLVATSQVEVVAPVQSAPATVPFDWPRAALALYVVVAAGMLLRLCVGLILSFRLIRGSRPTDKTAGEIEILESSRIPTPVTLGILRPVIVLPETWQQWDEAKLNAVLAHERSHIDRYDPAVQLTSAIHLAVLWFSPLAWFLHSRIIRVAEEASDDAAVAMTADRAAYAEILLDFMRSPELKTGMAGVPMSRYGRADRRLHRILDATTVSRGLTRLSLIAILVIASPLAYVLATAQPRAFSGAPKAPPAVSKKQEVDVVDELRKKLVLVRNASGYLTGLGTVSAATVTVRPLVDGPLLSVSFQEGQMVKAGDTLALVESKDYQSQLEHAIAKVDLDTKQVEIAQERYRSGVQSMDALLSAQSVLQTDVLLLHEAEQRMADTSITAPVSGRTGLRLVEPGNVVHRSDTEGIVRIAQVQPISVLFTLPERFLQQARIPLDAGQHPAVEAWSPDGTVKLATGVLTAMDNQIDAKTGTATLKATFSNKDRKLFPSQFVNVRVFLK